MWTEALEQPGGYLQAQTLGQERGGQWRGARAEPWAGMSWKCPGAEADSPSLFRCREDFPRI